MRFVLAFWVASFALSAAEEGTTIVRFGKLWDGTGGILTGADVAVERGKISAVRKRGAVPKSATLIDLSGYSGMPGMIDAHTHITYYWDRRAGATPLTQERRHPAVQVYLAQENARKTLETGVTTARDLSASGGMDYAMRDLIRMGAMVGPRLFVSGAGISGRPKPPGPDEVRRMVEERVKAGSDWIKLFASTGGFQDVSGNQTLSFEEMQAAVEAAHSRGKRIAIHSYGPSGFRDAVRAGPDSIEHGADVDDDTLREMARKRIVWVPTIDHNRYYMDAREEYKFAPGAEGRLGDYVARNLDSARRAHKLGVRFAMGSDAVFTMFGQNTRELEWFVKAGLTPDEALRAATVNGAVLLGVEESLGKVRTGFIADLVAVEGEPWKEIEAATRRVRWVMKDGVVVVDNLPGRKAAGKR